jgi:acyl-CoA dehydrogenase
MRRSVFTVEQDDFRSMVRDFLIKEVEPDYAKWEEAGRVPRELYSRLGDLGVIGLAVPEEYGGGGQDDYRFNVVLQEEINRATLTLGTLRTHMDVVLPYFLAMANEEQRARWFPGFATGELFTAIAMTEPGTGSDLAGVATTARREGDHFILNGAKTFISGGFHADLVVVLTRTSPVGENRRAGLSLLVVERGMPGYTVGRALPKIGIKVQDTVELSFEEVRVPAANLLGDEGEAFGYLGRNLPQERVAIAVGALAAARAAMDLTVAYVKERQVFGKPVAQFQNTKFELAAIATDLEAGQALLDNAVLELVDANLSPVDAAKVKLYCTELQGKVVDRCLQLFGGYGYVTEYPIARLYADARVTRIYGGTSEVMKSIISKSLGL